MTYPALARGTRRAGQLRAAWPRLALPTILLLYGLLGSVWSFVVPLGEGPDEPAHLHYALFLRTSGHLPVQGATIATSDVPGEGHQPPLAYILMQPFISRLSAEQLQPALFGNPEFRWNGGTQPNAYLHGQAERPPYQGTILAWHLTRLLSVALGMLSITACYATVRALWPEAQRWAAGAAMLIAFNPQWLFHQSLVSNDPLLITLASWLIYLSIVATKRPEPVSTNKPNLETSNQQLLASLLLNESPLVEPSPEQIEASATSSLREQSRNRWMLAAGCGILLGLALLTKQSALALFPVPLLGLWLGRRGLGRWGGEIALLLLLALSISGWWYIRNRQLYGDLFGMHVFQQTFATGDFRYTSWQSWLDGGWNLLRSSVAEFGWMTVPLPDGAYAIAGAILLICIAGLLASASAGVWRGRGRAALVLIVAFGGVLGWTVAFAATAGAVAWQGRFLFPAAPALAVVLIVGLAYGLPRHAAVRTSGLLLLLLAVALPWTLIRPVYASPARAANEVPRGSIYARLDYGWKRAFELHDATFARVVPVDSTLQVGLTWHLVEPVTRPWTVFIHIVDDQKQIVAKTNAEPIGGKIPTNLWVPGDWFRDEQHVDLTGVAPGIYRVRVGLYYPETGDRLGVYNEQGKLIGDLVNLGTLEITAR